MILSVGPAGNQTRASRIADWRLTNKANQVTVKLISFLTSNIAYLRFCSYYYWLQC